MGTYVVGAIVLVCLGLAVRSIYKSHRKGGCSCGCAGCSAADKKANGCH